MEISKEDFMRALQSAGVSENKAEENWLELEKKKQASNSFSRWMYFFGALIIIAAMTWWMTQGWEWFGGLGLFLIAIAYAGVFSLFGAKLWKTNDLKTPGGLLITIAVCMAPLAIYGLQTHFGWWPELEFQDYFHRITSNWILIEVGTILAGILALRFFPFPFLMAPIFFSALFLTVDATSLIQGNGALNDFRLWISLLFGLIMIAIAYGIDRKQKEDFAFWGYFFGGFTFWMSLSTLSYDGEQVYFIYLLINILLMIAALYLKRNIFMVLGAFGTFLYFSHLAYDLFKDSMIFPFAMTLIGLSFIYLGILYQKNREKIETKIQEIFHA